MRASASIHMTAPVAIKAKNAEPNGVRVFSQPKIGRTTAHYSVNLTVLSPISIFVVDGQENRIAFSTTRTFEAIMAKCILLQLGIPQSCSHASSIFTPVLQPVSSRSILLKLRGSFID